MPLSSLFSRSLASTEQMTAWARSRGIDPVLHGQLLRAASPMLRAGSQRVLAIAADPIPWLDTVRRFAGNRHELVGCRQGVDAGTAAKSSGVPILDAEFDIWSALRNPEGANTLGAQSFTLVTAIDVVDRLYHPGQLFGAVSGAMAPRAMLIVTAANVGRLRNVAALLGGGGLTPDLDALVGHIKPADGNRPRVREYCWQELAAAALASGLVLVSHRFFERGLSDAPKPTDAPGLPDADRLRALIAPFLKQRGQLQSEMILIFRKAGPMTQRLHRARRGVRSFFREARAAFRQLRRRFS